MTRPVMPAVFCAALIPTLAFAATAFSTSLQIAAPGPRADRAGLTYSLALRWAPRVGAAGYRTFMWTDAVGAWYPVAQGTRTTDSIRAFRSGCTAFVVIALPLAPSRPKSMIGIDTTNIVRFPLSAQPALCPRGRLR